MLSDQGQALEPQPVGDVAGRKVDHVEAVAGGDALGREARLERQAANVLGLPPWEGWDVNHKRTYKLYCELGLQLRNKTPKRRVKAKLRDDHPATRPSEVWAMDFLHDQLATGKKIRVLTVVDTFSRYVPVLDARFSYRAEDVVRALEQVCPRIGYPKTIRVDQGSEFVSRDLDLWAYAKGVTLDFSRPGKPTDNAYIEAFNGRFRAECLNAHWFLTLADAAEKMEDWRRYYNEVRPRGAIGHKVPISLLNPDGATSQPS